MTIFSPGAGHDTFTVDPGEIVYVPRGYLHHIENINQGGTKFAIAFNHELPKILEYLGQLVQWLTTYLELHSELNLIILAISKNLVKIYS